jgi:tRNA/tmRNA/rRNA uracil-C5-methylase (TrmA/RlmC/RlmD family)
MSDNSNENILKTESSEIMENSVFNELIRRENAKLVFYSSCFQQMSPQKKEMLLNMKSSIQQEVIEYIKGNRDISFLPQEERDLISRLNTDYVNFVNLQKSAKNLLERGNNIFQINLNNIEKRIYNSFYNRISFYLLEKKQSEDDVERARAIIEKLMNAER